MTLFGLIFFFIYRANLGIMLARDYAYCHMARSTIVILVANNVQKLRRPAKSLNFKSYQPLVGPTEMQGSCTAAATKSQGAHACYSSDGKRSFHNSIFIETFYQ